MKKIILSALLIGVILTSCKKEEIEKDPTIPEVEIQINIPYSTFKAKHPPNKNT